MYSIVEFELIEPKLRLNMEKKSNESRKDRRNRSLDEQNVKKKWERFFKMFLNKNLANGRFGKLMQ
jgi:hypothetical protein